MTCIIEDPEGRFSVWLSRVDETGQVFYEVQMGRTVYWDVPTLAQALELCGLPALGWEGLIE